MKRLYSNWLDENGVCSSEWKDEQLVKEFIEECTKSEIDYEVDIEYCNRV